MENDRIFGLDLFRAQAIFLILLANCFYMLQLHAPLVAQLAGVIGFLGLEMFFVLCGFLLANALYPIFIREDFGWISASRFIRKRLLRIVPLYFIILLVNIGVAYGMDYGVTNVWKYFLFLQNFAQPIPAFFPESWGLPVIVFAIVMLPLVLRAFARIISTKQKPVTFLLVLIGLILIFTWTKWIYSSHTEHHSIEQWDASLKTVAIFRFDSVFIGALIGWFYQQRSALYDKMKWVFAVLGIFGIVFIAIGVGYFQLLIGTHKMFWNIFYLPITSFSLAFLLPLLSEWVSAPSLLKRSMAYLSQISYSIYLVHFSLVLLLAEHYLTLDLNSGSGLLMLAAVFFFGSILLGIIIYHCCEKPLNKLLNK